MAKQTASLKFANFSVLIEFKAVKYARIKISKNGEIKSSVPKNFTLQDCKDFIDKHTAWIEKTLSKIQKNSLENDEIMLFGKIYKFELNDKFKNVEITQNMIFAKNEGEIYKFANLELKKICNEFIANFLPFINRPINRVVFRKMETRWGSCNHKKGYINLSLNLVKKDLKFIEYVVLHELTHLIYPHHRSEFYEFISKIMPDFKERIKTAKI
ncbi:MULTISPECIES: M48 family metallopeptidase [unclassified Campylobacter]|uniref:M48 family metallopeptidase n=1 Tax=unclassified Campylobacter TaxID=2593542 RepID=UPI0022E9FA6B|nr:MULTISPECIES: SprT family zinc-dependent metalloprotease [unclassified Campylobacter]MDA3079808.1 M48 family metallopeptidase [Campylobacter sp. CS_NA2]MDA3085909.1 M48 family metallopeptidase [Campylobacter sp. CS_ED1]MDA3090642.1 M48 family metallopeptidase [Campylobacter sp. CS_ED2]WBR50583.1 SprT family zinc-dependent metalloprotease [Campylobacter sp. CS_NA3]